MLCSSMGHVPIHLLAMPQKELHLDSLAPILPHHGAQRPHGMGSSVWVPLLPVQPGAGMPGDHHSPLHREPRGEAGAHCLKTQNPRGSKVASSSMALDGFAQPQHQHCWREQQNWSRNRWGGGWRQQLSWCVGPGEWREWQLSGLEHELGGGDS